MIHFYTGNYYLTDKALLTQALTLLQCEFGFSSRSIETLLKAVEKGKGKRMQVDIKRFPRF